MSEFELPSKRVFVAGHRGMVGRALVRRLAHEGAEILSVERERLDLRDSDAVLDWMKAEKPDAVVLAAAKVGGIVANDTYPVDFLLQNLQIQNSVISAAFEAECSKVLFLGSSCIYPKFADQPIREEALLTGTLEPTNEWYAIAKIAGIKLCQAYRQQFGADFISAMPTNLYGPFDNFDLQSSHVLPALLRKAHEAKMGGQDSFEIWGSGSPKREFLHVDDLADACVHLLKTYSSSEPINIGYGDDISIADLACLIGRSVGLSGEVIFDRSKPDGTPRKLLDVSRIKRMGWAPQIGLEEGVTSTYEWFLKNYAN